MHTLQKQTDCYNSRVVVWFTLVLEADCIRQPVPLYFPLLSSFWNEEKRRKQQGNYTSVDVLYKSHKKVFWMKTSACRDGTTDSILKKTAKQYGMTPEQMLRGKNRGKWKGWQPLGVELRTPLAWAAMQCSATKLQQPDNQQTPQSSICSYYIHFPLFSPHNIYFQHEARCSGHHNTFTPSLHFVPFFQLCMFTVCWQLQFPSLAT